VERYFHNEPDENDEPHEDMEQYVQASRQDIMDVMHIELAEHELNERLLKQAHRIASAEWKWIFKSTTYKIKKIERIFNRLKKVIEEE